MACRQLAFRKHISRQLLYFIQAKNVNKPTRALPGKAENGFSFKFTNRSPNKATKIANVQMLNEILIIQSKN